MRIDPYKPLPAGFQPRVAGAGPSRLTPPLPHNDDCEDIQDIQDDVAHAAAPLRSGACDEALNSEDELDQPTMHHTEQAELERHFEEKLHARGLRIRRMEQDGNCLFRAVSDRVYGDADRDGGRFVLYLLYFLTVVTCFVNWSTRQVAC